MSLELNFIDVPDYLKSSLLYKNFEYESENDTISIPEKYLINEVNINCVEELENLLHVVRFWMLDNIPFTIYEFVDQNKLEDYSNIFKEFSDTKVIEEIKILIDYNSKDYSSDNEEYEIYSEDSYISFENDSEDDSNDEDCNYNLTLKTICRAKETVERGCLSLLKYFHKIKCPLIHELAYVAIENSHFEILEYLNENGCILSVKCSVAAAKQKDIKFIKYLKDNNCKFKCNVVVIASKHNNLYVLKFLFENGYPLEPEACDKAARYGSFECLKFLHENGCPWGKNTLLCASECPSLKCFKYAHENGCVLGTNRNYKDKRYLIIEPFNVTDLDFVKYLFDNKFKIDPMRVWIGCMFAKQNENKEFLEYCLPKAKKHIAVCNQAVQYGLYPLLTLAHESGCPWNNETFSLACEKGTFQSVKYLFENGCPWNKESCSMAANNIKILKFLHENGCPWDDKVTYKAALKGNLDCLMYALENDCPVTENLVLASVVSRSLRCLEYLHEKGHLLSEKCIKLAIEMDNIKIIKFLYENGCPFNIDVIVATAKKSNSEKALKYFQEKGIIVDYKAEAESESEAESDESD